MANKLRTSAFIIVTLLLAAALFFVLRDRSHRRDAGTPSSAQSGEAASSAISRGGELVVAIRQDPPTFLRYAPLGADNTVEAITHLVHGTLTRVDRLTGALEPWLAERWTEAADHLSFTLTLRDGLEWSDGRPFTAADVLFTFEAVYDTRLNSPVRSSALIDGRPIAVSSPDAKTVVLTFPAPFGPGLRILGNLPIVPKHKLEASLRAGTMGEAWGPSVNPSEVVGMGPFRLTGYAPAERMTFERNAHYWRKGSGSGVQGSGAGVQLPYLDKLTLAIVREQDTEMLRIEGGQIDISAREIRAADYGALRKEAGRGRVTLADAGVGLDPNMLWFNLAPQAHGGDPRKPWLQSEDFRKAISHAIDRQAVVDQVYSGLAVPVYGPVTPGNKEWYVEDTTRYAFDPPRARALLTGPLGFADANQDGMFEDRSGRPVRFALLTQQQDTIRTRTASVIQAQLRRSGIAVDIVALDPGTLVERFASGKYDAIYFGVESNSTDPALNLDLWLSSGSFHVWNPGQAQPGTDWERRIDELMLRQVAAPDVAERKRLFAEVQRIFSEHIPVVYLAAPRLLVAMSPRVMNARPAPLKPLVLWSADTLAVKGGQSP